MDVGFKGEVHDFKTTGRLSEKATKRKGEWAKRKTSEKEN